MLRPKIPTNPLPTGTTLHSVVAKVSEAAPENQAQNYASPAPAPAAPSRPVVQVTPGTVIALIGGGTAVVLVVGVVLVSMLIAIAVSAVSVAVCAVVLRSLLSSEHTQR